MHALQHQNHGSVAAAGRQVSRATVALPVPASAGRRPSTRRRAAALADPQQLCRAATVVAQAAKGGFGAKDKQSVPKAERPCTCGSGQQFKACCQPYLDSSDTPLFLKRPPTAEACLRAQFSAYALKKHRYILKTTSMDNPSRKGSDSDDGNVHRSYEQDVKGTMNWAEFRRFEIVDQREEDGDALISFQMESRVLYDLKTGQAVKDAPWQVLKQMARFRKEQDGWMHLRTEASNWDRNTLQVVGA